MLFFFKLKAKGGHMSCVTLVFHCLVSNAPADMLCNEKPLTTDQACWYLNERTCYEEFSFGNLILIYLELEKWSKVLKRFKH